MKKIAVVLFNLGGPDSQESVEGFLFNLFHDKAIIRLPEPLRFLVAKLISKRRAPIACAIYEKLGGSSPILKNTQKQAAALEKTLNDSSSDPLFKTFIAMRYWHPFITEAIQEVKKYGPDEIVLMPLYPQYSTTTTQSSFEEWKKKAKKLGFEIPTQEICCYPQEKGFIRALAKKIRDAYNEAKNYGFPRILFSAHGLPEKIIKAGDPYQNQCELTAEALRKELALENIDAVLCFQSRVGRMKWIGPATDNEVRRAGKEKKPLVIVPIAFVSDNAETLVEIDHDYRLLALQSGVSFFANVPTVGIAPDFIDGLAQLIRDARTQKKDCLCSRVARVCPP